MSPISSGLIVVRAGSVGINRGVSGLGRKLGLGCVTTTGLRVVALVVGLGVTTGTGLGVSLVVGSLVVGVGFVGGTYTGGGCVTTGCGVCTTTGLSSASC